MCFKGLCKNHRAKTLVSDCLAALKSFITLIAAQMQSTPEQAHWELDGKHLSAEETRRDRITFNIIDYPVGEYHVESWQYERADLSVPNIKHSPTASLKMFLLHQKSYFHFCDQSGTGEKYSFNTQGLRDFLFASFLIAVSHRGPESIRPVTQRFMACNGSIFCKGMLSSFSVAEERMAHFCIKASMRL